MSYDEFFMNEDKPYAENLNDTVLLANAFDFDVDVKIPSHYSNGQFMNTTVKRKAGVSVTNLTEALDSNISIENNKLKFNKLANITFAVYPNFNQFNSWKKIEWSAEGTIAVSLFTKDMTKIVDVQNGEELSSNPELSKLDTVNVVIKGFADAILENMTFWFRKKVGDYVASEQVHLTNYYNIEETENAIQSYHDPSKANKVDFEAHETNEDKHIIEGERENWNNMTSKSDFEAHINDNDIHITSAERLAWNQKANATDLTNHINSNLHITDTERAYWNTEVENKATKEWSLVFSENGTSLTGGNFTFEGYTNGALCYVVLSFTDVTIKPGDNEIWKYVYSEFLPAVIVTYISTTGKYVAYYNTAGKIGIYSTNTDTIQSNSKFSFLYPIKGNLPG